MSFLFFLFIFVLIIGLLLVGGVLNLVFSVLRGIFSLGRKAGMQNEHAANTHQSPDASKRKRFNKVDAEDAEFEEVKF